MIYFILQGKPYSPSNLDASDIKANQITVSWTPPEFDGSTPIIGYLIEFKAVSALEWSKVNVKKATNTHTFRGLDNRKSYQFRVSARNKVGLSLPSILSQVYETLGKFSLVN